MRGCLVCPQARQEKAHATKQRMAEEEGARRKEAARQAEDQAASQVEAVLLEREERAWDQFEANEARHPATPPAPWHVRVHIRVASL